MDTCMCVKFLFYYCYTTKLVGPEFHYFSLLIFGSFKKNTHIYFLHLRTELAGLSLFDDRI